MGKVIRVTPEELEKASGRLAEISENYTEIYKKLMEQAQTMGEAWEGADNIAFVDQITGFCTELERMSQKILSASETLMKQKEHYVNRQETNITEARKLTN
ncbi:MAG: WXG100 family type VII secretion target [Clostridium sp.]|nr:WXG100 family type VII secretion target [Clostridium sp.]